MFLSLEEKRRFLARVVRARLTKEEDDSDLWQEIELSDNKVKRKLPGKLDAITLDSKLAGDGAAENVAITHHVAPDHAADVLAKLLAANQEDDV